MSQTNPKPESFLAGIMYLYILSPPAGRSAFGCPRNFTKTCRERTSGTQESTQDRRAEVKICESSVGNANDIIKVVSKLQRRQTS